MFFNAFYNQKDIYLLILSKLSDKDLLSFSIVNKYTNKLCKYEDFWRARFIIRWGQYNYSGNWRKKYFLILKYLNDTENFNKGMCNAAKVGDIENVCFFIYKGATNLDLGLYNASLGRHLKLIEFFNIKKHESEGIDERFLLKGIEGAARGGHLRLLKHFMKRCNKYYQKHRELYTDSNTFGIKGAAQGGHLKIVEFLMKDNDYISKARRINLGIVGAIKGKNINLLRYLLKLGKEYDYLLNIVEYAGRTGNSEILNLVVNNSYENDGYAMWGAARGGHSELVKKFAERLHDEENWNMGMYNAARGGYRHLIEFFIAKGANEWNTGMVYAARGGHQNLVELFINKGADKWNMGMWNAARGGYRHLVEFFIAKGANNWNMGMYGAAEGGHRDLVDFFIIKGATMLTDQMMSNLRIKKRDNIAMYIKNSCKK